MPLLPSDDAEMAVKISSVLTQVLPMDGWVCMLI